MRILMLSWEYPPRIIGGISRVVYDLAQKLGERNLEVHVLTYWEPGTKEFETDHEVYVHRVHAYDVETTNFVDWVLQLNYALIEHSIKLIGEIGNFDLIHAHDWLVAFAAKTVKHAYKSSLVTTIHATEHGRNNGIRTETQTYIHNIEKWLVYESQEIIVNSEYMKNEIKEVFNIDAKTYVIPNGVNIEKFDQVGRVEAFRKRFAKNEEKIVFFVGRMVNEKGVHILIEAIPKIIHHVPNTKFVIVGKGVQLNHIKWKAWNMNVSHKIIFTGYINDEELVSLYRSSDVAVFPSLYEPFGIVCLEAMGARVPVVVSDTGGFSGIVEHGINGLKCYTGNANSLADNVIEVLKNEDLAQKLATNGWNTVKTKYSWDSITDQIIETYERALFKKCMTEIKSESKSIFDLYHG
jgi:glycogen(starch) synthase